MSKFSIVEFYKEYFSEPNKEWYDDYKEIINEIKKIRIYLNNNNEINSEYLDKIFDIYISKNNGLAGVGPALSGMHTSRQKIKDIFDNNEFLQKCFLSIIKNGSSNPEDVVSFNKNTKKIYSENDIGEAIQINRRFVACCSLDYPTAVSSSYIRPMNRFLNLLGYDGEINDWYLLSSTLLKEIDKAFTKDLKLSMDLLSLNKTNNLEFSNRYTEEVSEKLKLKFDFLLRNMIPYFFCEYYSYENKIGTTKNGSEQHIDDKSIITSRNIILYGPPGTGKTFNTMAYALSILLPDKTLEEWKEEIKINYKICRDIYYDYINKGRIAFTTFHQSYSYEDFIEGIKPDIEQHEQDGNEIKSVIYDVEPGIFKALCERATGNIDDSHGFEKEWNNLLNELQEKKFIEIPLLSDNNKKFKIELNVFENGLTSRKYENEKWIQGQSKFFSKSQMYNIYKGLPGIPSGGHDNYRKAILNYMIKKGLIPYETSKENKKKQPFIMIIDEINRGNISKIFGELITLIEDSKRDGAKEKCEVILPYSKLPFSVPDNVYIIGTMNTADRSIAFMDTALRRRFNFIEMSPNAELLTTVTIDGRKLNLVEMLNAMNRRIEFLYDREHKLGHAFFMQLIDNPSIELLTNIFKQKIIPLLQEYFYDNYENIRLILGDDGKKEEYQFIRSESFDAKSKLFRTKEINDFDLNLNRYSVNNEAFNKIESYIEIYDFLNNDISLNHENS
ncbi:5-methylcytosine-specific restriction enzyme B [Succinivibrio dextrinosolvens DSM 3072]|uniref:5-methylcytosine-specific restriction enzyme B n=1 Tax=Succinivibrio dextrinosolvens DSM 3072 TaxID=1123324 RepID=A0A1T4V054_9GAMM|nr:AAA family ATPase [Succinivibrio dextrinosolvens]SKA58011.1 5-methylcytosine-specific restriction enzyme B [Succinivibrio dextrinosolvens DSM 3072]